MDWLDYLIPLGFVLCGIVIGYACGYFSGSRDRRCSYEPTVVRTSRRRLESKDVLNAEVIE